MIVNSAKEYRRWMKAQEGRPEVDENYIGCSYESGDKKIKGFFNLFHGKKDDIEKYLPSLLDIAEDNQAIYEFLQNAVDCGATHFWAFYNDEYFLAVNNGTKFDLEGISSILNIAQSTKTTSSSIGRLGIGFKLAHRLVGKGNGTYELVHGNKGPIIFSWDKREQLGSLMSTDPIHYKGLDENPYLFKIIITNFPVNVGEWVKNLNYNDDVLFQVSELYQFRGYVTQCLHDLYMEVPASFDQGTLFFIMLGENKKKLLDADLETLKNGIEYSMNTLKQLGNICFNGETILKKQLVINESSISKTTELFKQIDPQYKEYDILYSFGYIPLDFSSKEYYQAVAQLQQSPNFYKYFPMGDEVDNMALFVHSDSFQIEANRRKLTNHHTNRELLPTIANHIVETMASYKEVNRDGFLQLYASILLTDKPTSQEKSWMDGAFFEVLNSALKKCIPTKTGFLDDVSKVKVKKLKMDLPLDQIGLEDMQWFYWSGDNHKEIVTSSIDKNNGKLGLEAWNINDVIEHSSCLKLNAWLDTCTEEEFDSFIGEIKSTIPTKRVEQLLPVLKLFKVGNDRKSRSEILSNVDGVILTEKTLPIISILQKVGVKCTNDAIESHPLYQKLEAMDDKGAFDRIKIKVEGPENWGKLTAREKLELVTILKELKEPKDVRQLKIFKNVEGNQCSLQDLISNRDMVEQWQKPFVICKEENFPEIQEYLVSQENMFSEIIENHYKEIITNGTTLNELSLIYQQNNIPWKDDFTIEIIKAYGSTEDVLSIIEKNPSKTAVDAFLRRLQIIELSSKSTYPPTSFEYRCIQVAAKVEAVSIRDKIKIDDTLLSRFTSSNDISFVCKTTQYEIKSYSMKLSDILPDDTQCALYGKVADMFSSIEGYKKVFSADSSNNQVVQNRLRQVLEAGNTIITPAQYVFILFTRWQSQYSTLSFWSNLIRFGQPHQVGSTIVKILEYSFENDYFDVLIQYKTLYNWNQYFRGKYLFSAEYTLEQERGLEEIANWCGQDVQKRELLKKFDMHFDDGVEIKRRKQFKENTLETWDGETLSRSFLDWVASLKPIEGSNQKKLLMLLAEKFGVRFVKKVYLEEDYADAIELDTPKYIAWKLTRPIMIYKIIQQMPCRIIYNDEVLAFVNSGSYKYFNDARHLYINGVEESEIAGALAQVYQDDSVPFDYKDYTAVCFDSFEEQRENHQLIEHQNKLIADLQKKLEHRGDSNRSFEEESRKENERKEYEQSIRDFLGGSFNMDQYSTRSEHIIACYRILFFLKEQGYQIAVDFDQQKFVSEGTYKRIKLQDGKMVNPASAKWGVWYIHPNVWRDVVEKDNWACVCTGNGENDFCLIKSAEDIKRKAQVSSNVLMKLHPSEDADIMRVIDTVYPGQGNQGMDIHLMIKMHDTPNEDLNSLFDKAFNTDQNNFSLDD